MQKAIDETKRDLDSRGIEYKKIKCIQELSDELMDNIDSCTYSEMPWILEARVKKNIVDKETQIEQLCIEIDERTDDEQIHWLTDDILSCFKK